MMKGTVALAVCVALSFGLALAQDAGEMPKPGPENRRLGYFVGTWSTEGEMMPNPFMPAGKFTSNDTCEWFEGGFAVVCHNKGKGPVGPTKGIGIIGYNAAAKVYTYYGLDNTPMAMISIPQGTVKNGTWTYNDEAQMGDTTMTSRYIIKELSPDSYTFKWEMLGEDGAWTSLVKGKSTRVK